MLRKPIRRIRMSIGAALAVLTVTVAATLLLPAAAANAAPSYWTFQNGYTGTCLTAGERNGDSGKAYVAACNGGDRQQWDWVNNDQSLRNKSTGLCLITDFKNTVNAVWTGICNVSDHGTWWGRYGYYLAATGGDDSSWLRTSPTAGAVYTQFGSATGLQYEWFRV